MTQRIKMDDSGLRQIAATRECFQILLVATLSGREPRIRSEILEWAGPKIAQLIPILFELDSGDPDDDDFEALANAQEVIQKAESELAHLDRILKWSKSRD